MADISLVQTASTTTTPVDAHDTRRRLRAIFIGSVGNLVEWYDIYAYTAFSLYFAAAFFPRGDAVSQQLSTMTIFAATYLVRPIGGWLFGNLADRRGRRLSLTLSVFMMCFGSLLIAVTPTYGTIGVWAPIILALARVIQGISLGGEYGASAAYIAEVSTPDGRGFYSSFQYVTLIGGQLVALIVLFVLQKVFLTNDQIREWGWRIPFVIGALLAVVAAVMRTQLHETKDFEVSVKEKAVKTNALVELARYPREVLLVIGLTLGGTAAFYTYTTYMQTFLKLSVGLDDDTTTIVAAASLLFAIALQPLYGYVSDHIGRSKVLIWFGVMGVIFTYPLLSGIQNTKSALAAFVMISFAWVIVSGYTAINAIVKAELFPTRVRATGVALPYALTVSIFGGTAPSVALWFKQQGNEPGFYWYLTVLIALSLVIYLTMRDTHKQSAIAQS